MTEQMAAASTMLTSKPNPAKYLQPLYKQLIQKPNNDTLHYYLGVCYYQMDDPVTLYVVSEALCASLKACGSKKHNLD
jgi:hypothetical protein